MITVVSGLPRSGTSLMMQMLAAGGIPILSDGLREPDEDNPHGYHEWEPVKRLAADPERIAEAEGRAVKVISSLLPALPADRRYHVVFMRRPLAEVLASQAAMIRRLGTAKPAVSETALAAAMRAHLAQVTAWLGRQPHMDVLGMDYHGVLTDPRGQAERIGRFLGLSLDASAMAEQVDGRLYRQRDGAPVPAAGTAGA